MKGKKKLFITIPAIVTGIVIALVSVGALTLVKEREKQVAEWNEIQRFCFSKDIEFGEDSINLTYDEIKEYKPRRDIYNSKIYYNALTEKEKVVYNALEYAFDHNYVYIFVDEEILADADYTLENIVDFMALDSPFLQQNVDWELYDFEMTFTEFIVFKPESKSVKGDTFAVKNFSAARTKAVQKAVDTVSKWKLDFSKDATDVEKARAIYKYVDENIEYGSEDVDRTLNYLCTAVAGETNCDGFANIYSLLCNINGLKCFEKYSLASEGEDNGHTWNTVLLSGEWYNVDCTPARENKIEGAMEIMRFGYSDDLQLDKPEYADVFPKSTENITPVSGCFDACSSENALSDICDAFEESETDYIIVAFEVFDEDECDLFQKVANRIYRDIDIVTLYGDKLTLCYIKAE